MKVQLPVRVEHGIWEKIKELAKKDNRTPSNYVDTLLKRHIEDKKQKDDKG